MRISKSKRFHSVASLLGMFVLLLQACSATPYQDQQKGVLVADFYADKIGSVLVLAKKDSPKPPAAVIEITPMDNFRVLELPAGDYTWQELREPGQTIPLSDKFDIRVHPGRSNYIGSLLIKSYEGGPNQQGKIGRAHV